MEGRQGQVSEWRMGWGEWASGGCAGGEQVSGGEEDGEE